MFFAFSQVSIRPLLFKFVGENDSSKPPQIVNALIEMSRSNKSYPINSKTFKVGAFLSRFHLDN